MVKYYHYVIFHNSKMLGGIGLSQVSKKSCELGYWLGSQYWGNGFATEAVNCILKLGFGRLKLKEIYASYKLGNKASKNVLKKCGFSKFGRKKDYDFVTRQSTSFIVMVKRAKKIEYH